MKETQKRAGTLKKGGYLFIAMIGEGNTQSRVIRLSKANNVQQKHLTILLIDGAHGHTHAHTDTQKWTPSGLY